MPEEPERRENGPREEEQARSGSMKEALRREARSRLRAISPELRAGLGARIEKAVWSVPEVEAARTILLFASLPSEVPTDSIAEEARRRGIRVVYPRCLPEAMMTLHAVVTADLLLDGSALGIREPAPECPLIELSEIDVAFIPGLAWDTAGRRLGRGAGFYDRLFADVRDGPLRLGLFFAVQRLPFIPSEPWDVPLELIVTENGIHRP